MLIIYLLINYYYFLIKIGIKECNVLFDLKLIKLISFPIDFIYLIYENIAKYVFKLTSKWSSRNIVFYYNGYKVEE